MRWDPQPPRQVRARHDTSSLESPRRTSFCTRSEFRDLTFFFRQSNKLDHPDDPSPPLRLPESTRSPTPYTLHDSRRIRTLPDQRPLRPPALLVKSPIPLLRPSSNPPDDSAPLDQSELPLSQRDSKFPKSFCRLLDDRQRVPTRLINCLCRRRRRRKSRRRRRGRRRSSFSRPMILRKSFRRRWRMICLLVVMPLMRMEMISRWVCTRSFRFVKFSFLQSYALLMFFAADYRGEVKTARRAPSENF